MQENRGAKGGTGCLYMFICMHLLVVWILFSQEGKGDFFKEKRASDPASTHGFELGLWVDSQPNQLVVFTVPDVQFPLSQPPQIPPHVSLSPFLSINLNTIEFSDKHEQCPTKIWSHIEYFLWSRSEFVSKETISSTVTCTQTYFLTG